MINIAICDDEQNMIDKLKMLIEEILFPDKIQHQIYSFTSGEDFEQSDIDSYNIVLLDVEIGSMNGMDIANNFRKVNKNAILIFISQYIEYTPEGYTVGAFRYILKPNIDRLFVKEFKNAIYELNKTKSIFSFKFKKEEISVYTEDIVYFESVNNKIAIYTNDNGYYEFYAKLDDLEKEIGEKIFLRIQQSLLVNIKYIAKIKSYKAILKNGEELATSRINYKELTERYARMKWSFTDGIYN